MRAEARRPRITGALFALVVAAAFSACSGASGPSVRPSPATPSTPLRELAGTRYIGTAVAADQLARNDTYRTVLAREFNSVTAENAMKWESVERTRGRLDFAQADELVRFAQAHGQKVRGHTLVWHNQLPSWLTDASFPPSDTRDVLRRHIADEVGHFRGIVYAWDVVNEPLNEDGSRRPSIWQQRLGDAYIADALRWAHEADPAAKLYINDYNVEGINKKSDGLYELARSLKAAGVPLDGIGIQTHLALDESLQGDLRRNIERFAALGLEVSITELDIRMNTPPIERSLAQQADWFGRVARDCLAVERCVGITVWGFTDASSWVPTWYPGEGAACLFDESYLAKPAYWAVARALGGKG